MSESIRFFVPGIPSPGGSKKAFRHAHTGKIIVTDAGGQRTRDWRATVADHAVIAMAGRDPLTGSLRLRMWFSFPRPKHHYKTRLGVTYVKGTAPIWHSVRPDTTKLIRAAEDALTGIVWHDDAQIADQFASKTYGNPGLHVQVEPLDSGD